MRLLEDWHTDPQALELLHQLTLDPAPSVSSRALALNADLQPRTGRAAAALPAALADTAQLSPDDRRLANQLATYFAAPFAERQTLLPALALDPNDNVVPFLTGILRGNDAGWTAPHTALDVNLLKIILLKPCVMPRPFACFPWPASPPPSRPRRSLRRGLRHDLA